MAFSSGSFSSEPLAAESGVYVAYAAAGIGPLLKQGSHTGKVNLLGLATAISPLLKYGSHVGSIHWEPRNISGRAMPVYPLVKIGTPEQALPLVPVSIGPLLRFARHTGILGKVTGLANSVTPLFKFGTPLASFVSSHPVETLGQLLKFGSHTGIVDLSGLANGTGPLLKFGKPVGPYRRRGTNVHILKTEIVVYAFRRKSA